MATFSNRSRYLVRVAREPALERSFAHDAREDARAYARALRARGLSAQLEQGEDRWLVRIRQKGYPAMNFYADSYERAEAEANRIEAERQSGLFIDYTRAHHTTIAELMQRYSVEVCPLHKGCAVETAILESFLRDVGEPYASWALERRRERAEKAKRRSRRPTARHTPRQAIEWLTRPLAAVMPTDINRYIAERREEVADATVDRELDLLSQVITWAQKTLRIELHRSPLYGVHRPRYDNERNRRLTGDEEDRLFAAAREEDRRLSRDLAVEALLEGARTHAATLPNASARKRYLKPLRERIAQSLGPVDVVPWFETYLIVLLGTAARRGEALSLTSTSPRLE